MVTQRHNRSRAWCAALVVVLGAWAGSAFADPPDRVARLSYLRGSVSFQPSGDDQWAEASLNRPLGTGDKVYTDRDSRVELEIGAATVRVDQSSTLSLLNLDDDRAQVELTDGVLNLQIDRVLDGQSYEVDTPTLAFVINQPGSYRIDVAPQGDSTMVTVFNGGGDVYGENNASYSVRSGNSYRFNDSALHDYEVLDLPRADDFDQWCQSRSTRYEHSVSRRYVSEGVIGASDLDDSGTWSDEPEYGHVWYPTTVEADWAPYRSGHWSWVDPWGWTWVDNAAWGFAPFHYGRWAQVNNRWGWCPGPIGVRPIYAPALVAFVGGGGWGTSVSVGVGGGPVGWFPLGPRDVFVPWYQSSRNYFTNVNVRNTTVINNVNITNVYNNYSQGRPIGNANYAYRNNAGALTAVSRETFVGARPVGAGRVQVNATTFRNAQVVSRVGIAPVAASFAASAGRGRPAPANLVNRPVIARTAPPLPAASIANRIQAIQRNDSQPVAVSARPAVPTRGGVKTPPNVPGSRIQVVGQNAPKPQPLPARGAAVAAGAAAGVAAGTAISNGRNTPAVRGPANGPVAPVAPNRVAPNAGAAAPGNRVSPTPQDRNSLPSSRFAPRPGAGSGTNPASVDGARNTGPQRGLPATNGAPPMRAPVNPTTRGPAAPAATRDNDVRSTPAIRSTPPSPAPNVQRNPPQVQRNVIPPTPNSRPQPVVRDNQRTVTAPVNQPRVEQRSVPQPRVEQRSVTPPPQQQRAVQPAQPRVVQPAQPRVVQPVQPRVAPPPQERRPPPPQRGDDKGKDKDRN